MEDDMEANHDGWIDTGRTTRWYEWVLILLLLGLASGARAGHIYKCTGPDGSIAYQDVACSERQQSGTVEIAPAPEYAKSPEYAIDRTPAPRPRAKYASRHEPQAMSFECRSADGQVFYRHTSCPHSVPANPYAGSTVHHGGTRGSGSAGSVTVSAQRVPREDACRQIHAAGAIGRSGREHDEDVSTYERNLGHDPCR
jgi:hypothetical protein